MEKFYLRIVFDRRNETKKDKTKKASVHIEVRAHGSDFRKLINTGIKLKGNQFVSIDAETFKIQNHPSQMSIRGQLSKLFNDIQDFVSSPKCKSLEDVDFWNKQKELDDECIFNFIKERIKHANVKESTKRSYVAMLTRLREFGEIKTFRDVTYPNIVKFDIFLRKKINSIEALKKRHRHFSRYINEGIKLGLIEENPYTKFEMPKGNNASTPIFLTQAELSLIEDYIPTSKRLEQVRDFYLFQCYTGLAFVDASTFSKDLIYEIGINKVISSNRQKTNESFIVPLTPKAVALLEKYDYELPVYANANYNKYLKDLAIEAKVKKHLTSHSARHTFATIALNKNVKMEIVSKALGHSSIKQTEHYARLLPRAIIEGMQVLLG